MSRVTVVIEDAHMVDVHLGDKLLGGRITALMDGDYSDLLEALEQLIGDDNGRELIHIGAITENQFRIARNAIRRARGES